MKKYIISLVLIVAIVLVSLFVVQKSEDKNEEILRIHIRANSNETQDQDIKYVVKDYVVETLSKDLKDVSTKKQAAKIINENKSSLKTSIDNILAAYGYSYDSNIEIRREKFPARKYGDTVYEDGEYDALIIELGEGVGDNWWCVCFPPLCFMSSDEPIKIRSYFKDKLLS